MVDLVVFDWDGTLMDSADRIVHCMQNAAASCGAKPADRDAIRNLIGLALAEAFAHLYPSADALQVAALIAAYRAHWLEKEHTPMPLFNGVREGLVRLDKKGILLGVATGKARRGLNHVLEQSGLGPIFTATRGGDESHPKPNPAMLLELLDVTGVDPGRALMVGDTTYDMQMAAAAGVPGLGVSWGSHDRSQLLDARAQAVFDCFDTLITHIEGEMCR